MIKTFLKWAESNKLDIAVTESEPIQKTIEEKRMRTGMTGNYPELYSRGQYTELGQTPIKATAVLDLQQKPSKTYGGQRAAD